jgi:blue copper oxidase
MKLINSFLFVLQLTFVAVAQNPLFIPPSLTGPTFNLNVQAGTTNFYGSVLTPTYGINGSFLSPTLIVNKGDVVTLNVINNLTVQTTMHWHGLHVAPMNDGGPHQAIMAGQTWSPSFEILNNAGTFWYHPHGEGKTDLHVSKGLAGMIIIHDPEEQALGLPSTYGVDDFPLIVQTKAFDATKKITIADHMDTALFVNGTLDPFLNAPAQIVRLRLLNGSSMRTFNFGFSNNMTFSQIATDGGLIGTPNQLTRLQLSPGERAEILVNLSSVNGQNVQLMNYGSEMADGIFGAAVLGVFPDEIHMYEDNFLNGTDFNVLDINVVAPTVSPVPVSSIPTTLVPYVPYEVADADVFRTLVFDTIRLLPANVPTFTEGPFGINGEVFDMDIVNYTIPLNSIEVWTIKNKTLLAHPFHIHDIQFNIIEKNGDPAIPAETGWKDVVLVMPGDSVKFITKFITFSDPMTPYMYHCHILHHEDDGMMGSFIVYDPAGSVEEKYFSDRNVYPNPTNKEWNIAGSWNGKNIVIELYNVVGEKVCSKAWSDVSMQTVLNVSSASFQAGIYFLRLQNGESMETIKLIKE